MSANTEIEEILRENLLKLDDVYACMVARRGLEGVVLIEESKDPQLKEVWISLEKTMDQFFSIINEYSTYGLNKIYFELGKYDVIFFILPETDTALVALIPALANRGLLEVELENTRGKIIDILKRENTYI